MDPRTVLDAMRFLQANGYNVAASDMPGLWVVNDKELTVGQVISLASSVAVK